MTNFNQAAAYLSELTIDEIREQLDLAGVSVSELDNQQVYETAIDCLLDD